MKISSCAALMSIILAAIIMPVSAGGQDPELLFKWAGAEVVHYDVVGEFSAPTEILGPAPDFPGKWSGADQALVKDRFELSFDWAPIQRTLVGKVVFKDFSSTVAAGLFAGACRQPPPLTGSYEHLDIVGTSVDGGDLMLTTKRTYPGGSAPLTNDAGCGLYPIAAATATMSHRVAVIPGTFLVMPALAPKDVRVGEPGDLEANKLTVGQDGKSMVLDDSRGWKYRYTLKIVKEGGGLK